MVTIALFRLWDEVPFFPFSLFPSFSGMQFMAWKQCSLPPLPWSSGSWDSAVLSFVFPLLSPIVSCLVLKQNGAWLDFLVCRGCSQGKAFCCFLSCPPTSQPWTINTMLSIAPWSLSGAPSPAKPRLPCYFHRNFSPVTNSSVTRVLLVKEVSWEFSTVQRVTTVHPSSPTLTQVSGHFGGPGSQHVERWLPVQVLKLFWI